MSTLKLFIHLLPNVITLGNVFCGFIAMNFAAVEANIHDAAIAILVGNVLDILDGRAARLLNCCSPLGSQLDSLADCITFVVAPAFLVAAMDRNNYWLFSVCSIYLFAGVFRIARLNVIMATQGKFFSGLVSNVAAGGLAFFTLAFSREACLRVFPVLMPVLSCLMVSTLPFPTFKGTPYKLLALALLFSGIAFYFLGTPVVFLVFSLYALSPILLSFSA